MKKLELTEEERHKRKIESQVLRNKRYKEKYNLVQLKIEITKDKFKKLNAKLQQDGLTKKQFIEDAIDTYLNKKSRN